MLSRHAMIWPFSMPFSMPSLRPFSIPNCSILVMYGIICFASYSYNCCRSRASSSVGNFINQSTRRNNSNMSALCIAVEPLGEVRLGAVLDFEVQQNPFLRAIQQPNLDQHIHILFPCVSLPDNL